MDKKILLRDLRKAGACSDGRMLFKHYFPHGAQYTFEDAHRAVKELPPSFINWWLEHFVSEKIAQRFYKMLDRAVDRTYSVSDWDHEDKRLARWLLKTVTKHMQGGDAPTK